MRFNLSSSRRSIAVLVAVLSIGFPVAGSAAGPNAAVVQPTTVRIDNFGRVNETYYRGAQPEGRDYADLAALGVKTVINLTSDDAEPNEQAMTERAGMSYVQIPMTTHRPPTQDQLAEFFRIVNDPQKQPVYVHCVGGRHRTGVMTAAYRMTVQKWSADQAFKEMKQYRFGADFLHSEFKDFVFRYAPVTPAPPTREARAIPVSSKSTGSVQASAGE